MVSKKTTQALILAAALLSVIASWKAMYSNTGTENVRPAVVPSNDSTTQTIADRGLSTDVNAPGSVDLERVADSGRPKLTSATRQGRPASEPAGIEAFTEPYRDIAIAAAEMGTLASIQVREGDVLRSGDVIAVMADEVLKASLEVARRSMNIEGTLKSAQADVNLRQQELEKLRQLRQRDHASQQELDRVEAELTVAEARRLSVREELEIKQLEFRRIEAQLEQRCIRSPIAGLISEVHKDAGEFVSPSDPVVARIVQLDPLLIVFSVPLDQRNAYQAEETVRLQLGYANQLVNGTVEYVAPTTDSSNSSIRVKVRVPNPNGEFQSGERAILLPSSKSNPDTPTSTPADTSSPLADRTSEPRSRR